MEEEEQQQEGATLMVEKNTSENEERMMFFKCLMILVFFFLLCPPLASSLGDNEGVFPSSASKCFFSLFFFILPSSKSGNGAYTLCGAAFCCSFSCCSVS